jgi:bifunctional DNase/RNase
MDLKNIFETGKPHLKKLVIINYQLVVFNSTIQVSYEGYIILRNEILDRAK